uniref:Uncharacterized protein n=1 Tax=Timema shepardi TaxID=629360 RepID=A0A7R9AX48_TIMSH|nr:unnamed protein product [Timema shepardi]
MTKGTDMHKSHKQRHTSQSGTSNATDNHALDTSVPLVFSIKSNMGLPVTADAVSAGNRFPKADAKYGLRPLVSDQWVRIRRGLPRLDRRPQSKLLVHCATQELTKLSYTIQTQRGGSNVRITHSCITATFKMAHAYNQAAILSTTVAAVASSGGTGGWNSAPNTQYHIQTDEGDERYFRYQTISGQYRKEKRLQDGTVVGSFGWVDPNGFLRLRDYVADNDGYRIVRTKMVFVGKDEPIGNAISKSKYVPSQGGTGFKPLSVPVPVVSSTPTPSIITSTTTSTEQVTPTPYSLPAVTTPAPSPINSYSYPSPSVPTNDLLYRPNALFPPSNTYLNPYIYTANNPSYSLSSDRRNYDHNVPIDTYDSAYQNFGTSLNTQVNQPTYSNSIQQQAQQFPLYDGIATTHNGFRYYLPRQYHEEENSGGDTRSGSFGYIDPFGIRRVTYYNTAPGTGFVHKKNNRYVGFNATPYDPRY